MRLLLTIFSIAVMSIPGPLRLFDGPPNVWIVTVPFVWLPTMMSPEPEWSQVATCHERRPM